MDLLALLLPDQLPIWSSLVLILASFFTSALTAAVGLGGGVALLALMANLMPLAALVPVHGLVQLGSNAGRAIVLVRHIAWDLMAWFAAGAVLGALAGGQIAITLPEVWLNIGIGLFLLWTVWGKAPRYRHTPKPAIAVAGFVSTVLSMFFGAAGPIGGAVLSGLDIPRQSFVATQAATALTMHILKIAVFGLLGFAFAPWAGLIAAMIISGFLGTLAGTRLLGHMPEARFRKAFRWVMTLLAINLLWRPIGEFLSI